MITVGLLNLLGSTPPLTNPPATANQVAKQAALWKLIAPSTVTQGTPGGAPVFLLGKVPQGQTTPYLVVTQLSGEPTRSLNTGQTGQEQGLARVEIYGGDPTLDEQIAALVGELLDCFQGAAGGVTVQGIFLADAQAQFPPPVHGDEQGNPVCVRDFEVWQLGF